MPAQRIRQLGDPILRQHSRPVSSIVDAAPILADLRDTLHEFQRTHGFGRGISAVQIGHLARLIYMEVDGTSYCLHNPEYNFLGAEQFEMWDDCFSFPHLMVRLARSKQCQIRYQDEHGVSQILDAEGPLSELIQHEMDHLDGVLAIDRALDANSFCTRDEYLRQRK